MASGYTNSHPRDEGDFYFETRFSWSSSYDPATNTSTVTFHPQIYTTVNMGNDLRMFNTKDNNGGVYRDGSLIYAFPTNYSSGNYLRTWSNPYEDWVGLFEAGDDFPTLTVTHNNNGAASIRLGLRGGVISMNDYAGAYSSWIDDGYYINLSESRSLIINYNANGGSGAPSNTYFYGSTESIVLSSTIPTRPGYTFLGWSASGAATTATYSAGQNIGTRTSSLALFAVWRVNSYTVTCQDRVGSASGTLLGTKTASYTYGSSVSGASFGSDTSYDAYYTGYHYTGSSSTITVDGNETVYRYFAPNTWTVSYNANGGSGAPSSQTKTYGVNLTLSSTVPTRTGYSFLGWSTSSTATSATYSAGGTYSANAGAILYAVWRLKTYSLSASQTNSSVFVNRTSSPLGGGTIGILGNGATLYYNDSLTITFAANTGYTLTVHTVNGNNFSSGSSHTVTAAVNVVSTATLKTFTLSISAGTGSTITVKKGSTTLSNGATITYGDELTITFSASTGYNLGTHTVNGSTFTSGGKHTVTAAVNVVSTATLKTFTLTILEDANSTIAVKRGSTTLSNGATITYGDELTITFSAATGYNLGTHTVNGSTFTSGGKHTVTAAVSVASTATRKTFTLSISADTGSTITVKKGSTTLSNGATITYGDELTITFSASTGYNLGTHTVNGSAFTSGGKHTVTAAVSVVSTATLKTFTLSISAGKGSSITAIRTGSPKGGASTGMLLNGSILYYDDVIEITVAAAVGYLLREVILNGGELSSPVVVKADIRIEATAIPAGVNIADGREDIPYQFAIDTGSVYEIFIPYLDNGQSWELY